MNAFFIHTPFQLFVAQNIIFEKKLEGNILFIGYNNNNIIDKLLINALNDIWSDIITIGDVNQYNMNIYTNIVSYKKNIKKIFSVIEKNISNSYNLYFGDCNCILYILLSYKFSINRNIYFFEEGLGHYCKNIINIRGIKKYIYNIWGKIIDLYIYYPLIHRSFKRFFIRDREIDLSNITKRYSLLDYYNTPKDELIHINSNLLHIYQEKIKTDLNQINGTINGRYTILLALQPKDFEDIFTKKIDSDQYIINYLNMYRQNNPLIIIKKHHRNSQSEISYYENLLSKNNFDFINLNKGDDFPLEVLIPVLKIKQVISFYSSVNIYVSKLYNNIISHMLIFDIYNDYNDAIDKDIINQYINFNKNIVN